VTDAIEIPQFIGRSYLTYDNRDILKRLAPVCMCVCVYTVYACVYVCRHHVYIFMNLCVCVCAPHPRVSGARTNLFMRFKCTARDGLLLWRGDSPMRANGDFLSLGIQDGALIFRSGVLLLAGRDVNQIFCLWICM